MRIRCAGRRVRRSTALAGALAMVAAGTADAAVSGTVASTTGRPLAEQSVRLLDSNGAYAGGATTDGTGAWSIQPSARATPPFTATIRTIGTCNDRREASAPVPADGAGGIALVVEATPFCASFAVDDLALVDEAAGRVVGVPGSRATLRLDVPSSARDLVVTLADGTVVGRSDDRNMVAITLPDRAYDGPLNLSYTLRAAPVPAHAIGSLRAGAPPAVLRGGGTVDIAAVVDISGSMSGSDRDDRRKDAVNLLIDLADRGDRLVGTGFDSSFHEIFPRTTITNDASKTRLKRLVNQRVRNLGGTNYDVAFEHAYRDLTAAPLNPATPKAVIFLTDGAHNGTYRNSHLRFAFNPSGGTWPICVVQLGRSFNRDDTARLKRIAAETRGSYVATPSNTQLEQLYFACRGRATGAATLLRRTATFRVGQRRAYARKVRKGQRKATFFVSHPAGRYALRLVQPGGRAYTRTTGRKVLLVKRRGYSYFEVRTPKAGTWRLIVRRLRTGRRVDRATTTITVQRRTRGARR